MAMFEFLSHAPQRATAPPLAARRPLSWKPHRQNEFQMAEEDHTYAFE